ncbi:MAG: hypothetical protein QXF46_09610 [Thermofilaceae archaeon]
MVRILQLHFKWPAYRWPWWCWRYRLGFCEILPDLKRKRRLWWRIRYWRLWWGDSHRI